MASMNKYEEDVYNILSKSEWPLNLLQILRLVPKYNLWLKRRAVFLSLINHQLQPS
ncbi:hypothetical protein N9L02_03345 [Gammaproteobacteria bacterium]|nr:hypothetical protein [Gammaproteobacteria bacterium]